MLDIIRKQEYWAARLACADSTLPFSAVLAHAAVSRLTGLEMAKIGHLQTAIKIPLETVLQTNTVISMPAGALLAPQEVGRRSEPTDAFDAVFSAGWLSGVPDADLPRAIVASAELVRPGGMVLHTFEFIVEDRPSPYWQARHQAIASVFGAGFIAPLGKISPLAFSCEAATLPDSELFDRRDKSPNLDALRMRSQTVGLVFAGQRI